MVEIWKDIPGYEGKYFISNQGRVKNSSGLVMKPMLCTNGYLSACLWLNGRQKKKLIHRMVANAFIENTSDFSEINHKDEDKTNNAVDNLEWCSHKYNMNYGCVKEKISAKHKGKKLTPEHRAKCASAKNKSWVHDSFRERLVWKDDVPSFLLSGYYIGRLSRNV